MRMNKAPNFPFDSDSFHRTAKLFMDSGEASSPEDAVRRLRNFRILVAVGPEIWSSSTLQAALLTIVNAGARSLLGGVHVILPDEPIPSRVRGETSDIAAVVRRLGGRLGIPANSDGLPTLLLGNVPAPLASNGRALQISFDSWTAAVAPHDRGLRLAERDGCVLAGVLAGALGLSEVFQSLRSRNGMAMRRALALSLWEPHATINWSLPRDEPSLELAPDRFWLIGLGNLGQAYLWTISFLNYSEPQSVCLTLQDFDTLSKANMSTSLLTTRGNLQAPKTRAMAKWADKHGFKTRIVERRFPGRMILEDDDPRLALCGLDNALGRSELEQVGFGLISEAGLGAGERYLKIEHHLLPGPRAARDIWNITTPQTETDDIIEKPGYQNIKARGGDPCGVLQLANRAVGVPFVGAVAATLVVAAACRYVLGGKRAHQISLNLSIPDDRQVFYDDVPREIFNPGFQRLLSR
jgi:hypothetical protein